MSSILRMLSSRTFYLFQAIWYPLGTVSGPVFKALRSWTKHASDSKALDTYSPPTSAIDGGAENTEHPNDDSHIRYITVRHYYPPGVSEIIGHGFMVWIGVIDEFTVLKYPHVPGDLARIQTEARILDILGSHPRIIASKGLTEHGLVLQRASNGSVSDYITSQSFIPFDRKLLWCKQAAEAISYIHGKRVIHCDINLRNFLLDGDLNLLLADFQGMLKSVDGDILLDGLSSESTKASLPRASRDYADVETDIFALGSAIYFIMTGHEVFPELHNWDDEEEIVSRFQSGHFPNENHPCSQITEKCWKQQYRQAADIVSDLSLIQAT
ncbi:uncharacterized protein N7482_001510 [Penicillium canariense]|uniref:Protein kinase domain-containing protein n=1 Tax=Penicillium canariense TaxID=189055 RepID=A0A9W9IFA2_9EURO|nr:uncharacterized protein N7482_001510 [Penicillium canariense]KAJ5175633.1 hypothetical protein N7482_001510 [Penicillium canariense]